MSKRAEEKALKAYPAARGHLHDRPFLREGFLHGYEQAEKYTIERAVAWLEENASKYIINCTDSYQDAPFKAIIGGKCWEDLRKAMED